jgi:hypothetical protein
MRRLIQRSEEEEVGQQGFQEIAVGISGGEYRVSFRSGRELTIPQHFSEKRVEGKLPEGTRLKGQGSRSTYLERRLLLMRGIRTEK